MLVFVDSFWGQLLCGIAVSSARSFGTWDDAARLCAFIFANDL
jgi:hypothetical protein